MHIPPHPRDASGDATSGRSDAQYAKTREGRGATWDVVQGRPARSTRSVAILVSHGHERKYRRGQGERRQRVDRLRVLYAMPLAKRGLAMVHLAMAGLANFSGRRGRGGSSSVGVLTRVSRKRELGEDKPAQRCRRYHLAPAAPPCGKRLAGRTIAASPVKAFPRESQSEHATSLPDTDAVGLRLIKDWSYLLMSGRRGPRIRGLEFADVELFHLHHRRHRPLGAR